MKFNAELYQHGRAVVNNQGVGARGRGTSQSPWFLKTPSGQSGFQAYRDDSPDPTVWCVPSLGRDRMALTASYEPTYRCRLQSRLRHRPAYKIRSTTRWCRRKRPHQKRSLRLRRGPDRCLLVPSCWLVQWILLSPLILLEVRRRAVAVWTGG